MENIIKKAISIRWDINIESVLEIEELGKYISEKLLWWIPLWWRKLYIYDEVPAITCVNLLWMQVILSGYPTSVPNGIYSLDFQAQFFDKERWENYFNFSSYLHALCKEKLECDEIQIYPLVKRNI